MEDSSLERIPVLTLASGDSLSIPVYTIKGSKPGAPSAYLQSAMHGSEVQGSLVLALLLDYLAKHPPLGDIRIVPNCNPLGLSNKRGEYTDGRFDPVRGDNWNRKYFLPSSELDWEDFFKKHKKSPDAELFKAFRKELKSALEKREPRSSGDRMAVALQRLSIDYDICLDLHCANRSVRHAYVPHYAKEDARYLGIKFQLVMPDDKFGGAMDEVFFAPWTELARRTGRKSIPVQSFTVELGSHEEVSTRDGKEDLESILNYLRHRGVVKGKARKLQPVACPLKNYHVISAPKGGIVEFVAPLGKRVKRGQVVMRMLNFGTKPKFTELKSPVSGFPILHHSSAIANEGAELFKIAGV